MMNAMAQTKPTSEELRAELKDLRSTATRRMEQVSRLTERCAELEDLVSRGTSKPTKGRDSTARIESRLPVVLRTRKIKTAFDRIGREQLSPNKPVTCL